MYDLPEVRGATDAFWARVAARIGRGGAALERERAYESTWRDPALVLSQCCGSDLVHALAGRVRVVAVGRYRAPGCEGTLYRSAILVREGARVTELESLRGATCAVNEAGSHSGDTALRAL